MKLAKLCVKNFRAIGSGPEDKGLSLYIEDNNIIFLIGENNVGKSSILSSYDYFYNEIQAKLNDFHKRLNLSIEIEVIIKLDSLEAKEFQINLLPDDYPDIINDPVIHIKKQWQSEFNPKSKTLIRVAGDWQEVSKSNKNRDLFEKIKDELPTPIWIRGMSTCNDVLTDLKKLVHKTALQSLKSSEEYRKAQEALNVLQRLVSSNQSSEIIEQSISLTVQKVFPNISLKTDNINEEVNLVKVLQDDTRFQVEENEFLIAPDMQGHGVQRHIILSACKEFSKQLKMAASKTKQSIELEKKSPLPSTKKAILLIEEPELYFHPTAIRKIREQLYDLAFDSEFQILCATHSPIIIDLTKPKNSLVRVVKTSKYGSLVYQAQEKELIGPKMLEDFNSHVCEAFFCNRVLLVEGATEVIAIKLLLDKINDGSADGIHNSDFHIVNCQGKSTIPSFQKILRYFKIDYAVFHDSDSEFTASGKRVGVWKINQLIWNEILAARKIGIKAERFVSISNFEMANGYVPTGGKPLAAHKQVKEWKKDWNNPEVQDKPVIQYLKFLLNKDNSITVEDHSQEWLTNQDPESVPDNFVDEEQLEIFSEHYQD